MPRRLRTVRTIITEVVMYVGMFVIVGHLCQNLIERYMMQKDLKNMKSDLNSLEMTISNMGMVYDNLLDEVQECLGNEIKKSASSFFQLDPKCFKNCYKKVADVATKTETVTNDFMQNFKKSTANFFQNWSSPAKDESTLTEHILNCFNYDDRNVETEEVEFCNCVYQCLSHLAPPGKYEQLTLQNQSSPSNQSIEEHLTETKEQNLINKTNWKLAVFPT